jgi:hypothetical protein
MSQQKNSSIPLIGGVLAAIAASLCCIGPLVLVMLGMGGAWVRDGAIPSIFTSHRHHFSVFRVGKNIPGTCSRLHAGLTVCHASN